MNYEEVVRLIADNIDIEMSVEGSCTQCQELTVKIKFYGNVIASDSTWIGMGDE